MDGALYFAVYPRVSLLGRNLFASGVVYGAFVWLAMTKIVVPMSNVRPLQHTLGEDLIAIAILMVCTGIPIAWRASRGWPRERSSQTAENP